MTRFLCFSLVMLLTLPLFAQDERDSIARPLPSNPVVLAEMQNTITLELRRIQEMLSFVDDPQLAGTLTARQKELTEQLRDILRQSQDVSRPSIAPGMGNPAMRGNSGDPIITGQPILQPMQPLPPTRGQIDPVNPSIQPGFPGMMGGPIPPTYSPPTAPNYVPPYMPNNFWTDSQQQSLQLPKELTEVKQSVDALQKEVASLKETIKTLETQILLLTRVISQNDRGRENGN